MKLPCSFPNRKGAVENIFLTGSKFCPSHNSENGRLQIFLEIPIHAITRLWNKNEVFIWNCNSSRINIHTCTYKHMAKETEAVRKLRKVTHTEPRNFIKVRRMAEEILWKILTRNFKRKNSNNDILQYFPDPIEAD